MKNSLDNPKTEESGGKNNGNLKINRNPNMRKREDEKFKDVERNKEERWGRGDDMGREGGKEEY